MNLIKNYSESKTLPIFIEYHFELNYENGVFQLEKSNEIGHLQ